MDSLSHADCVIDTTQKRCDVDSTMFVVGAQPVQTLLQSHCLRTDSLYWRLPTRVLKDGCCRHDLVLLQCVDGRPHRWMEMSH